MNRNDCTPTAPTCQPKSQPQPLVVTPANLLALGNCPHAMTLTAWAADRHARLLFSTTCHRWSCGWCARQKIKKLAHLTALAGPNRFLTLTLDPWLRDAAGRQAGPRYSSPRVAFEETAPMVSQLMKRLRQRFGEIEYLRVTEVTQQGWPHYHMLLRSAYLPHAVVKEAWQSLSGATIVDVRQVKKEFRAYWYLVKYLANLRDKSWTDRHVSYSRGFFPCPVNEPSDRQPLTDKYQDPRHPHHYLAEEWPDDVVLPIAPGIFQLPDHNSMYSKKIDPASIGLIHRRRPEDIPVSQQSLGFDPRDPGHQDVPVTGPVLH